MLNKKKGESRGPRLPPSCFWPVTKIALPVGTYSVRFDLIDGTTQKKYASYVYNDVEVKQGSDEKSASVQISSIDAVKE